MIGHHELGISATQQEKKSLDCKSIPILKGILLDLVNNISIPYNKELLIDIIIDMKKENGEIPN